MKSSYFPLPVKAILLILLINQSNIIANSQPINDTQFIKTTCQSTPYPDLCLSSLSDSAATIHSSCHLMTVAALTVALTHTRSTSSAIESLAKSSNALTPRDSYVIRDCIEEFGDSVEELKMAVEELKDNNKSRSETEDIRTWVSAALTDDDTCMDGLVGDAMNGNVKESIKEMVVNVAQLTSIALSLVSLLK
ncbi:21 kDa protein [Cucumis sativus]|uniref:pectinesterase n=1 Tax=Cucumis sativus TaxID=3659 RepID=A0A0A0L1P3_CUCSA|nr:21 kDa protein [Cucumis sativus]